MSPTIFNIVVNDILYGCDPFGLPIGNTSTKVRGLLFADDLVILAPTPEDLQHSLDLVSKWAEYHEMSFGIPKCGAMCFGDSRVPSSPFRLMGHRLPFVDFYKYLGIDIRADLSLRPWINSTVARVRKVLASLYTVLTCRSIPIPIRSLMVKVLIDSRLRYGCELLGSNQSLLRPLDSCLASALKLILGSFNSKNTAFGHAVLMKELSFPPFYAKAAFAMVRAYSKYTHLQTFVRYIVQLPAPQRGIHHWGALVRRWVKAHKIPLDQSLKDLKFAIFEECQKRVEARDKTRAPSFYKESKFADICDYLQTSLHYPQLTRGFMWVARMRMSAVWTARQAACAGLIPPFYKDHCVSCCARLLPSSSHLDAKVSLSTF